MLAQYHYFNAEKKVNNSIFMATLILKSLATGYILTAIGLIVLGVTKGSSIAIAFFLPIFVWPATLIVSGLALLVFKAIEENRK